MHVCLWDIDGTLLHSSGAGRLAMDAALADVFGVHVPIEQGSISGRTDRSIASDQFRLHGIDDTPENWRRFIDAYLERLPGSLERNGGHVLPGIAPLLDQMTQMRGEAAIGLLTGNVPRGARIKLGHFGIARYFGFGGYGDRHQTRDEVAHEALAVARNKLGAIVRPERVWVIGDTPWDVRCARAIGGQAVAVATGFYSVDELAAEKPDLLLADFTDAAPLWAMWER
jgi:phosphoglycolate phosphatase